VAAQAARAVIEKPMKLVPIILWAVWAGLVALILGLAILSPPALLAVAALAALLIIVLWLRR
jgi:hypothetical protein